jgi:hypothetical protein
LAYTFSYVDRRHAREALLRLIVVLLWCFSGAVSAQQLLKVSQPVWLGLAQYERDIIQQRYLIEVAQPESFGIIIDNQGVDESTPGSSAGSNLGQAVANAAYVDKAFRDGNYSAKTQLGAILLGGLLGSALDSGPVSRFHYRYTIRAGNGKIQSIDEVASDPFRHPVGVCVDLPAIRIASDQQLCGQDLAGFRRDYLSVSAGVSQDAARPLVPPAAFVNASAHQIEAMPAGLVDCKPTSLAPIRTTAEKCRQINGRVIQ